ncbi:type III secretion system translocon subunit SctE [Endozoicomonas arenosclerae]|uniref:type III secretion system translocon subunit SctE n=1 Tax=Endozoicomonas arenosclerae TaxID=1633495 RepID=UPI000781E998|nr:type III secretion system translocon subunit SctE [Endozoicomonas arenosclerae]
MSSISQGPVSTEQTGNINQASFDAVDYEENPVQRGFSNQNSYSRTEGSEAPKAQINTPVLDAPAADAESVKATDEVLKYQEELGSEKSAKIPKTPGEVVQEQKNISIRKQTTNLQGKHSELEKLGFSKFQIDGMLALADPNDPENSLASMHSVSARVKDMNVRGGDSKLNTLFDTFEDVMVRFSAITEIPDDLKVELNKDLEAFTKAALNTEQPLDIESATTLLIQIQSKLQNERLKFDQESIKVGQVEVQQKSDKIIQKIRDSIERVAKAKESELIGKIFGYIALGFMAIATAVVAVVGLVFTGGALTVLAVSLMVAATALMVTMIVSSETNNFMMKIFDGLAGDDKKGARIGAMVFWSAIMIALTAGAAVAGGFAGVGGAAASTASAATSGAATGTSTAATVAATGANTAATAASTASKITTILTKLAKIAQLIGGASQVASGGADVATSVYNYQADIFRAESLENKADLARIQQVIDDTIESIERALEELQSGYSVAASIIKANHETKTTLARNLRA